MAAEVLEGWGKASKTRVFKRRKEGARELEANVIPTAGKPTNQRGSLSWLSARTQKSPWRGVGGKGHHGNLLPLSETGRCSGERKNPDVLSRNFQNSGFCC